MPPGMVLAAKGKTSDLHICTTAHLRTFHMAASVIF
jgi:hypothetical protein